MHNSIVTSSSEDRIILAGDTQQYELGLICPPRHNYSVLQVRAAIHRKFARTCISCERRVGELR